MFSLVALMCLYLGTNNIRKAFVLAPFGQWQLINWSLFVTGIVLIPVGLLCIKQAVKDYKEAQRQKAEKEKAEKEKRQQQFFYDEEDSSADN